MPLKTYKGYDRVEAMKRMGGRCACNSIAVDMARGAPVCQRCLDLERRYYGRDEGRHHVEQHREALAAGADANSKYQRTYRVVGVSW